jgi:hypothetical protein
LGGDVIMPNKQSKREKIENEFWDSLDNLHVEPVEHAFYIIMRDATNKQLTDWTNEINKFWRKEKQ